MELIQENPLRYPVFKADQVLTKDDLNDLFNYLDGQDRLSRAKLIGMGIVCGLEIGFDAAKSTISISKGCGITSWGYLIVQEEVSLAYYRPYKLPANVQYEPFAPGGNQVKLFELLTAEEYATLDDPSKATSLAEDASFMWAVVLFLEMKPNNAKNCVSGDCNNAGITVELSIKRLLVHIADLPGSGYNTVDEIVSSDLPDLNLKRFNVPAGNLKDFNAIYQAYISIFDTTISGNITDSLANALEKQYQLLKPLLPGFPGSPFLQFKNTLISRLNSVQKNVPYGIQYFYGFVDDLIKAYNELKEKSSKLISECCPDESRFPLHLKLGFAILGPTGSKSDFRESFIYSPLYTQQQTLIEEVRLLFKRIKLMADTFFVPSALNNFNTNLRQQLSFQRGFLQIKVTPSNLGNNVLSKRAIPYYYQITGNDPIQNSWDYDKTKVGKANQNLSYNSNLYNTLPAGEPYISPLQYSIEKNNFFRVEGHIGQNYYTVLKEITRQKNTYRLPFDVVAVKLGDDATDIQPGLTCSFQDLEAQYDQLRSDLYCKLGEQSCFYASQMYTSNIFIFNPVLVKDINLEPKSAGTDPEGKAEIDQTASINIETPGLHFNDVLKYATYLPVNLRYIFQANIYVKGQFLSNLACFKALPKPVTAIANYVGTIYLARIKRGAIPAYPPESISNIPDYLVKLLDLVEEVVATVFYTQLAYFHIDDFTAKVKALMDYANALKNLLKNNPDATPVPAQLADFLTKINSSCNVDRLKTLVTDYQTRMKKLQSDLLFNNFITKHPGIDHKAGVPKGGTLILVYYEKPVAAQAASSVNTINTQLANVVNDPSKLRQTVDVLKDVVTKPANPRPFIANNVFNDLNNIVKDAQYGFTADQQNLLLKYINKKTTVNEASAFQLPDKAVVADFYLPYLCCSDCGGITYVFPPEPVTLTIDLQPQQFCNNDAKTYPVKVQPSGGSLTGEGVTNQGQRNFVFSANGLSEGKKTLVYTLGTNTASIQVDVFNAIKEVSFGFQFEQKGQQFVVNFSPAAPDNLQYKWDFDDGQSETAKVPAAHVYTFDGETHTYNVTFTVNNGVCSTPVTKPVVLTKRVPIAFDINPKRYLFSDKNSYPFNISPMVKQEDIIADQTSDVTKLFNPAKLNLLVEQGVLNLHPLMPRLQATLDTNLQYQNLQLAIQIVKPSARFTIIAKAATGNLTFVAPTLLQFSAVDTNADQYQWLINGDATLLQPVANPPALTADQMKKIYGDAQKAEIVLITAYAVNGVKGDDKKGTVLTTDLIKLHVNKGVFEPGYE